MRSHCSANMFSFDVVERKRDIMIDTWSDSTECGDNAMIWAPR